MKKNILIAIASSLLTLFLGIEVHAKGEINFEEAVEKRNEFGLVGESDYVAKLMQNNELSSEFGIFMTTAEEDVLIKRLQKFDEEVLEWKLFLLGNPRIKSSFLDLYVEHNNNSLVHLIFNEEPKKSDKDVITKIFNNVVFEYGKFGGEDLEIHSNKIKKELQNKVSSFILYEDLKNQQIVIEIDEEKYNYVYGVAQKFANDYGLGKNFVKVKKTKGGKNKVPFSRRTFKRPLEGGMVVENKYSEAICSLGFPAVRDSKVYFITAGHCFSAGQGVFQGGSYIGHFSFFQMGGNADAGGIYVGDGNQVSNYLYGNFTKVNKLEIAGNDILGDIVCKNGMNGTNCGSLLIKGYSHTYLDTGSGKEYTVNNMRVATFVANHGDSGATVYFGDKLKGIVTGPGLINGKVYSAYSHVTHISRDLGLEPITWR